MRKDYLPAWSTPYLKQIVADQNGDNLFVLIGHVLFSFSISNFPDLLRDKIDAVYINSVKLDETSRLLVIGGDDHSGSPPLKVLNLQEDKFLWVTTNLSNTFRRRAQVIGDRLDRRYGPNIIESPITSAMVVDICFGDAFIVVGAEDDETGDSLKKFSLDGELLAEHIGFLPRKVAIHSGGSIIAAISARELALLDASSFTLRCSKRIGSASLSSLTFNKDSNRIVAISEEGEIICVDLQLNVLWAITVDAIPRCVQYDSFSECFLIGTNLGDLLVVDEDGIQMSHVRVSESIRDIAIVHNGRHVFVGCKNMDIHVFVNEASSFENNDVKEWEKRLRKSKTSVYTSTASITDARIFISYSSSDRAFARMLESKLSASGFACWRDEHSLVSGRISKQISHAMLKNDVVIVILSKDSIASDWVKWELDSARAIEKRRKKDVICPIAIDSAWQEWSDDPVLKREILKYHILSFDNWNNKDAFEQGFTRLVSGIRENYLD
jgi:hypothetical protein